MLLRAFTVLLIALALPATASASYVSVSSGNLSYSGGTNQVNAVTAVGDPTGVTVHDSSALTPSQGCTAIDANTAKCTGVTAASFSATGYDDSADLSQFSGVNTGIREFIKVVGSPGNDVISIDPNVAKPVDYDGGPGNDTIYGGAGADTLRGGDGNDYFTTGAGADNIDGGPGADTFDPVNQITKGPEDDHGLNIDLANPDATPPGYKRVYAVETINGTQYDDVLRGTDAHETFDGRGGNDTLEGRGGQDSLIGGPGDDTILARDGVYDSIYCDGYTAAAGDGTNDSAVVDAGETAGGCEHVDRPAGAGTIFGVTPNGTNATLNAKWTGLTWATGTLAKPIIPKRARTSRRVSVTTAPGLMTARLLNNQGQPISGANVVVREIAGTIQRRRSHTATTDADGRITLRIAAWPSRDIRLEYAPQLAGGRFVYGRLKVVVPAKLSLKLTRARIKNGAAARFTGTMTGKYTAGATVDLQTPVNGKWFTFDSAKVRAGRFSTSYRFTRTTRLARYRVRATLHPDADIPYATGSSAITTLTVLP